MKPSPYLQWKRSIKSAIRKRLMIVVNYIYYIRQGDEGKRQLRRNI